LAGAGRLASREAPGAPGDQLCSLAGQASEYLQIGLSTPRSQPRSGCEASGTKPRQHGSLHGGGWLRWRSASGARTARVSAHPWRGRRGRLLSRAFRWRALPDTSPREDRARAPVMGCATADQPFRSVMTTPTGLSSPRSCPTGWWAPALGALLALPATRDRRGEARAIICGSSPTGR